MIRTHKCQQSRVCNCSQMALEPNENCPMHGHPWPPRCWICGRFMKWSVKEFNFLDSTTPRSPLTIREMITYIIKLVKELTDGKNGKKL